MTSTSFQSFKNLPPLTRSRTVEQLDLLEQAGAGRLTSELLLAVTDDHLSPARRSPQNLRAIYPGKAVKVPPEPLLEPALTEPAPSAMSTAWNDNETRPMTSRLAQRRRFRQMESGNQCPSKVPARSLDAVESGLFDILADDSVLKIMHLITALPATSAGLDVHDAVVKSARLLRTLLLTCRRMVAVLHGQGVALHKEMAARAATQIVPSKLDIDYPFTQQMRDESFSSDQLTVLREAIENMVSHCAGPCCQRIQNEFNRKTKRLYVAARRSTLITASASGDVAFVSSRMRENGGRTAKERAHNRMSEGRVSHEFILMLDAQTCQVCRRMELQDLTDRSAPQSMRSNHAGTACSVIRSFHATWQADNETPHSCVSVWDTRCAQKLGGAECFSGDVQPPDDAVVHGAINAQDAWWVETDTGEQLVVLWSTAYVHPMGSVVGHSADTACYYLAVYCAEDAYASYELETYTGPFPGKAQTASPTSSGVEVAILLRKSAMGHGPGSLATRETVIHNVFHETRMEITHKNVLDVGRGPLIPPHPADLAICPSAVGLSPSGDCIIAIHRRVLSVIVEILIRTSDSVFVSTQTIDVTHWTTLGRGEPTVFDQGQPSELANSLKLPYHVTFSPCGRFAAIVDQRPLFQLTVTNHAVVVLDMALRHERRGVRALPLAPVEDVAPRSLEWTPAGIWMQARFGSLLLKNV